MRIAPTAIAAVAVLCSGCSVKPKVTPSVPVQPLPATQPASPVKATIPGPPPPTADDRLSRRFPRLFQQWQICRAKDGDAGRSDRFGDLASLLDDVRRKQPQLKVTETEMLSFLGLPDRGASDRHDSEYIYYYNRADTKSQWVVIVTCHNSVLDPIGWNDAGVNDFSALKPYHSWADMPVMNPALPPDPPARRASVESAIARIGWSAAF